MDKKTIDIIARLRAKESRDNRKLLDAAADEIEWLSACRTPKKPVEQTDRYPSGQYACPSCGAGVGWHTTYQTPFGEMQSEKMHKKPYCECCGQAIDWGEVK